MINLGPRSTVKMGAGDHIVINTPGAGGWGCDNERDEENTELEEPKAKPTLVGLVGSLAERAAAQLGV